MAMKILGGENPQEVFLKASNILVEAVQHTLGPKGINTAVCTNSSGIYNIINDGKMIVQDLTINDPAVAPALQLLKQSCFETNRMAGDGTTSTILMTNALLKGAINYLKENYKVSPIDLMNIIEDTRDKYIESVISMTKEITEEDYENVATVALGGKKYAPLIADAFKFVGKDGDVTFIKEDRRDVVLDCIDGITLSKTELPIVKLADTKEFSNIECIFIYEKVDRFAEIIKILNKSAERGKKTLLFYNEMSWDASSNIYANTGSGAIDVLPIRLGAYGTNIKVLMEMLASYTNTEVIDGVQNKLSSITDWDKFFGKVNKALISTNKVVINAEGKIKENDESNFKVSSKSCIIRVGGYNKIQQEEIYRRIEDAVASLGSAISEGIVQGGGITYINAFESMCSEDIPSFIGEAVEIVYKTIIYNMTGLNELPEDYMCLFPNAQGNFEELNDKVFDSAMVVKEVIRNSFSLVGQMITTKKIIHEMIR